MARKRDLIKEITDKRSRLDGLGPHWVATGHRIQALLESARLVVEEPEQLSETIRLELKRCLPVATVACIEAYFRMLIEALLSTKKYSSRIEEVAEEQKFEVRDVLAVEKKTLTVGAFIAHVLRIRKLDDINRHMSRILDHDFLNSLRVRSSPSSTLVKKKHPKLYWWVQRLFQERNILAHELAPQWDMPDEDFHRMILCGLALIVFTTVNTMGRITTQRDTG